MEKMTSTVVIHKHVDGADTLFYTMPLSLVNNPLGKWLGVIRMVTFRKRLKTAGSNMN